MFNELRRSVEEFLQMMSEQAHEMLDSLLAGEEKGPSGQPLDRQVRRIAEEQVFAAMLEFPTMSPGARD